MYRKVEKSTKHKFINKSEVNVVSESNFKVNPSSPTRKAPPPLPKKKPTSPPPKRKPPPLPPPNSENSSENANLNNEINSTTNSKRPKFPIRKLIPPSLPTISQKPPRLSLSSNQPRLSPSSSSSNRPSPPRPRRKSCERPMPPPRKQSLDPSPRSPMKPAPPPRQSRPLLQSNKISSPIIPPPPSSSRKKQVASLVDRFEKFETQKPKKFRLGMKFKKPTSPPPKYIAPDLTHPSFINSGVILDDPSYGKSLADFSNDIIFDDDEESSNSEDEGTNLRSQRRSVAQVKTFTVPYNIDVKMKNITHRQIQRDLTQINMSTPPPSSQPKNLERMISEKEWLENQYDLGTNITETVFEDNSRVKFTIDELLTTEEHYTTSLQKMDALYLTPMLIQQDLCPTLAKDPVFAVLYNYLQDIIQTNLLFKMQLEYVVKEVNNLSTIGNLFLSFAKQFGYYGHYAQYYDKFLDKMKFVLERNELLQEFVKDPERRKEAGLTLRSLLIMPVQRLPRYILLLEDILKKSTLSEHDLLDVTRAKNEIVEVSNKVNETVRNRENRDELRELSKIFTYNGEALDLVASKRYLIHEGLATKYRRFKNTYYFHLFSDVLLYSDTNLNIKTASKGKKFNVHRFIWLREAKISDVQDDRSVHNAIRVQGDEKAFLILFDDPTTKKIWLEKLGEAQSQLNVNTSDVAPVWQLDGHSSHCFSCTDAFTFFNRRHHCRKCGHVFDAKCSTKKCILGTGKPKRVCDLCYMNVAEEQKLRMMDLDDFSVVKMTFREHRNTETAFTSLLRELQEYSKNLDSLLEVFGRPILDSFLLHGKEAKNNPILQKLNKTLIKSTVAIFFHTLEEIVSNIDGLHAELERLEEADNSLLDFLVEKFNLFGSLLEHNVKYASRLPVLQWIVNDKGPLCDHASKCDESQQLPSGYTVKMLLSLPSNHPRAISRMLQSFDTQFSEMHSEKDLEGLRTLMSKFDNCYDDMLGEFQTGAQRVDIMKMETQFLQTSALAIRGRNFIKEELVTFALNSDPKKKPVKLHMFNDIIAFSVSSWLLHIINCADCVVTQTREPTNLQIIHLDNIYSLNFSNANIANEWFTRLEQNIENCKLFKDESAVEYVVLKKTAIRDDNGHEFSQISAGTKIYVAQPATTQQHESPAVRTYQLHILSPIKYRGWVETKSLQGDVLLKPTASEWCSICRSALHERFNAPHTCDLCRNTVCSICYTENFYSESMKNRFLAVVCTTCVLHCNAEIRVSQMDDLSKPETLFAFN